MPGNFQQYVSSIRSFEQDLSKVPSTYLCTDLCPCPTGMTGWIQKFTSSKSYESIYPTFRDRAAQKFKRNFTITTSIKDYQSFSSVNANLPLFVNSTAGAVTFDNFWDCYQNLNNLELSQLSKNPNYQRKVTQISDGFEEFARKFETELSCNGICYPGLFFYFNKLEVGPPQVNCISGLNNILKGKPLPIGILLLISCFLTFLSHINSYPICACSKCCQAK